MLRPPHRKRALEAFAATLPPSTGIVVTGATGWLGTAVIEMAMQAGLPAEGRPLRAFGSTSGFLRLSTGALFEIEALSSARPLAGGDWLMFHFAFLGKERTRDLTAEAFIAGNDRILEEVLQLAHGAGALRMVFASSGAAYEADANPAGPVNPYSLVKRRHELEMEAWTRARDIPVVIPRIFNIGGPFGNKLDLYALSSIAAAADRGAPLTLSARHPVFRSYVHVEELVAVLVAACARAQAGTPIRFDTRGECVTELGDLAALACSILGRDPSVIARAYCPSLEPDHYVGDLSGYREALRPTGLDQIGLTTILQDTIADLRRRGG